jgi:hypothetical protein
MLYNKDIKKGKANSMKYIEDRIAELAEGKKITYRGYVYWLNQVTREIYRHSVAARDRRRYHWLQVC